MSRRRLIPTLTLTAAVLVTTGCDDSPYPQLYRTQGLAPDLDRTAVEALDHLGPTRTADGVNFSVYSEAATRIDLLLFDNPEANQPERRFEMERMGDVFNLYVEGVGLGQQYGYVAWGPNWPFDPDWRPGTIHGFIADVDAQGNRFNPNKLLIDPYTKALHRDHDWGRASNASGPDRTQSTWGAAAKSVVVASEYTWSDSEAGFREARRTRTLDGHGRNDLIIYEVHPKGFTADPSSGVDHPGTYRGIGEMAAYLSDLGVTAVELLPIHEKPLDGGYWGYNNLSFFAPELSYASDPDPRKVIDEFKQMVDQLHQQGIEVLIDVVYNHTGEGGLWRERIYQDDVSLGDAGEGWYYYDPHEVAGIYSMRGLDNAAYYALSDDNLTYWNNTGVGNQTRPNHRPMRRLILDSLRWHVEELHVDGFRFDLAPILGEVDGNYNNWADSAQTVLQDIVDDPVLNEWDTRIIAEPWSACWPCYNPVVGGFPASSQDEGHGWAEWNNRFRDWWRAFINDDDWALNSLEAEADGGFTLTGSEGLYGWNGRRPYHSVNFVTVHDGFTMFDLLSYSEQQNGCGPLNPVCCDDPTSSWCEQDSGEDNNRSRDWGSHPEGEALKRQMMRNLFTAMMIAHGTPLLLGGDEWMRTQHGNNNAYSTGADNAFNWFQWGTWQQNNERLRMHDFVRKVIQLRKDHSHAFAPSDFGASAPFSWKSAQNTDDVQWGSRNLMVHYYDPSAGPELAVLINMERSPVEFTLPEGRTWRRILDTQRWFDFDNPDADDDYFESSFGNRQATHNISLAGDEVTSSNYTAQDSSIVILEAAP